MQMGAAAFSIRTTTEMPQIEDSREPTKNGATICLRLTPAEAEIVRAYAAQCCVKDPEIVRRMIAFWAKAFAETRRSSARR